MDVQPLLYADLIAIPVTESGEAMVNLLVSAPQVICSPINGDTLPYCREGILVRHTVAEKLHAASSHLSSRVSGAKLQVVYGYRHPSTQERYYNDIFTRIEREHPTLSPNELIERTHALIAVPSVAGHPAGAAIDVTIALDGVPLDMGTPIWDLADTARIPTFASGITETHARNRMLLREVLVAEGFAPFDGEWWHFSYGDREWAAYYKQPAALYAPVLRSADVSETR
jgi:zinc D-Ala-D-Ala dipeptidase